MLRMDNFEEGFKSAQSGNTVSSEGTYQFMSDTDGLSVAADSAVDPEPDCLSVSDAMALAKHSLESVVVTMIGEVSEVSVRPGYKAAYFTVKDESASLPCMMWNNRYKAIGFDLVVGQLVRLSSH